MDHLTQEDVQRYADGELDDATAIETHIGACAHCANAVVSEMQLKRAVLLECGSFAAAARRPKAAARPPHSTWIAIAALLVAGFVTVTLWPRHNELADLHTTILASANPVDVLSTDRHTVKPWFEGRLPFSFTIPEFGGTPFRLIGGRVAYVAQQPVAYLMIGKASHRLSLFVARGPLPSRGMEGFESLAWSEGGLTFVAVGDVPRADLEQLRRAFRQAM